jgi:hypothetical protein
MSVLSDDAQTLLQRARRAEHAVDLYLAPGALRVTADRLVEVFHRAPLDSIDERAPWNLLFAAGELSLGVDVYRAHDLFRGAVALVERIAADQPPPGDPRAIAAEMAFDFFFARAAHPLIPLRSREVLNALVALPRSGRVGARAALHGLGHLVRLAQERELDALAADAAACVDEVLAACASDPALEELADEARAGSLR